MQLVLECTFHADLGESVPIGSGPFGTRAVAAVTGGWVRGERLTGTVVGPGADWATLGADGYVQLDVRAQIRTDDGAHLYVHYTGSLELTEAAFGALGSGGSTTFDDQYFRTHVRIESGDERYAWVNRALFVGRGRIAAGGVDYEIYRLA